MHEKTANELLGVEGHVFDRIVVIAIPISKGDLITLHFNHPVIGNGYAVGVSTQIVHYGFSVGKRGFAVNNPLLFVKLADKVIKRSIFFHMPDLAREFQLTFLSGLLEIRNKLSPKQPGYDFYRKKEILFAGYPLGFIRREPTSCNDTVQMGVIYKGLGPGMQNRYEADLCSQMPGVLRQRLERFRCSPEEDVVQRPLVS